jgi:hypothetical protein
MKKTEKLSTFGQYSTAHTYIRLVLSNHHSTLYCVGGKYFLKYFELGMILLSRS